MTLHALTAVGVLLTLLSGCAGGGGEGSPDAGTPEPTPTPFPAGVATGSASSAILGPAGGALDSADGRLKLSIPAGALATDTTIAIQPITNTAPGGDGSAYRLTAEGATFAVPVQLTFPFDDADLAGTTPDALGVAFQDEDGFWWQVTDAVRDDAAQTVTVETTHFSDWSRVYGWQLRPPEATIHAGEQATLQVHYCEPQEVEDAIVTLMARCPTDEEMSHLPTFTVEHWAVDGIVGGSYEAGLVSAPSPLRASYSAPLFVVGTEVHAVSVRARRRSGQVLILVSNITVVGSGNYEVTGTFDAQGVAALGMDPCPQTFAALSEPRLTDRITFVLGAEQGGYQLVNLQNDTTTLSFTPITLPDGSTARMDSNPEVFTATGGTVIRAQSSPTSFVVQVNLTGSWVTGGCTALDKDGEVISTVPPIEQTAPTPTLDFEFASEDFVDGSQTVSEPQGYPWTWVITETE